MTKWVVVAATTAAAVIAKWTWKKSDKHASEGSPRLPLDVVPSAYRLTLTPSLTESVFHGAVEIDVTLASATDHIILNAAKLAITSASVIFPLPAGTQGGGTSRGKVLPATDIWVFDKTETLYLRFSRHDPAVLPPGALILHITFKGELNDNMKGFYRSVQSGNGEPQPVAVTQFEPTDARMCFPCWDEPAFKATFDVTVVAPTDALALSNMPVSEVQTHEAGVHSVRFQQSPPMSTYLLAVVVGKFDSIEATTETGTLVRVFTEPGKTHQGAFALDCAVRALPFFEKYFGCTYPLPKLDMVAISDFGAGAMENFGLVTFRSDALLVDPSESSAATKQGVAITVTHELAHQWFGNLVTMQWWTHLWLNEGFASWVSYLATDALYPDWRVWATFVADESMPAMGLDALEGSHAVEVEVTHAHEVNEIFDLISYCKGASIIRMLHAFLGDEAFRAAMREYMRRFVLRNATTADLWAVFTEVSGADVSAMMATWTGQQGYPLVSVDLVSSATGGSSQGSNDIKTAHLMFTQRRFLSSGEPGGGHWIIPITLQVQAADGAPSSANPGEPVTPTRSSSGCSLSSHVMKDASASIPVPSLERLRWLKVNTAQAGFFRVHYARPLAERLEAAVRAGELGVEDRNGLLEDSYALCKARVTPASSLLRLMAAYHAEGDVTVLQTLVDASLALFMRVGDALQQAQEGAGAGAVGNASTSGNAVNGDGTATASDVAARLEELRSFLCGLLRKPAAHVGWEAKEGEGHLQALTRSLLLEALVSLGDAEYIAEGIRRFNGFLADQTSPLLPADLRKAAYLAVHAGKRGGSASAALDTLVALYRQVASHEEKVRILRCLAKSSDAVTVRRALDFSLSSDVRMQDAMFVIRNVHSAGRQVAWDWLRTNWPSLWRRFQGSLMLPEFIMSGSSRFASRDKADEVAAFFAARKHPSIARTVQQAVECVRVNVLWVASIRADAELWQVLPGLAAALLGA
eukprot:jgi/Mesvir1/3896/Mv19842-RA.1